MKIEKTLDQLAATKVKNLDVIKGGKKMNLFEEDEEYMKKHDEVKAR